MIAACEALGNAMISRLGAGCKSVLTEYNFYHEDKVRLAVMPPVRSYTGAAGDCEKERGADQLLPFPSNRYIYHN